MSIVWLLLVFFLIIGGFRRESFCLWRWTSSAETGGKAAHKRCEPPRTWLSARVCIGPLVVIQIWDNLNVATSDVCRRNTQWERLRSFAYAEVGGQVSCSGQLPPPAAPKLDAWLSKDPNSCQTHELGGMNLVFWARWDTEEATLSLFLSSLDFEDDRFLLSFAWLDSGVEPWAPLFFGYRTSVGVLFKAAVMLIHILLNSQKLLSSSFFLLELQKAQNWQYVRRGNGCVFCSFPKLRNNLAWNPERIAAQLSSIGQLQWKRSTVPRLSSTFCMLLLCSIKRQQIGQHC